jgi:hypothetical protein
MRAWIAGTRDVQSLFEMCITNGQRESGLRVCKKCSKMSSGVIRKATARPNSRLTRALCRAFIVPTISTSLNCRVQLNAGGNSNFSPLWVKRKVLRPTEG